MNKLPGFTFLAAALALTHAAAAQQVWTGLDFEFQKDNYTDWRLPENQDRITDLVWITRAETRGLFNASSESNYTGNVSPADTEWSYGSAADYQSLTFEIWRDWAEAAPPRTIGREAVVHLITDDIYIDIMFTQWTAGGGGGFAYLRAVPAPGALPMFGLAAIGMTRRRRGVA